jgi:hypothetical protein
MRLLGGTAEIGPGKNDIFQFGDGIVRQAMVDIAPVGQCGVRVFGSGRLGRRPFRRRAR